MWPACHRERAHHLDGWTECRQSVVLSKFGFLKGPIVVFQRLDFVLNVGEFQVALADRRLARLAREQVLQPVIARKHASGALLRAVAVSPTAVNIAS